jgi:hypothetical protein
MHVLLGGFVQNFGLKGITKFEVGGESKVRGADHDDYDYVDYVDYVGGLFLRLKTREGTERREETPLKLSTFFFFPSTCTIRSCCPCYDDD